MPEIFSLAYQSFPIKKRKFWECRVSCESCSHAETLQFNTVADDSKHSALIAELNRKRWSHTKDKDLLCPRCGDLTKKKGTGDMSSW